MAGRRWLVGLVLLLSVGMLFTARPASAIGCDVNGDGTVNLLDLVAVATHYGAQTTPGDASDINADGWVDLFDLVLVARCYGEAARTPTNIVYPAPVPPISSWDVSHVYRMRAELRIGMYAVREWAVYPFSSWEDILTISAVGQPDVAIEYFESLDGLTGRDVTGNGFPDVVLHTWSGGNHCCFGVLVYELGRVATKVLETTAYGCRSSFEDLDADGSYELVFCDAFSYSPCCEANHPMVKVILDHIPGQGYVPASPRFPYAYYRDIQQHTLEAAGAAPGDCCGMDETTKCAVLPLILDYLYSGRSQQAWDELYRLYQYSDVEHFRYEIEQAVYQDPLFMSQ